MATNVYATKEQDLSKEGFRWCNKDCRWESRRNVDVHQAEYLVTKYRAKVEVRTPDRTVTYK